MTINLSYHWASERRGFVVKRWVKCLLVFQELYQNNSQLCTQSWNMEARKEKEPLLEEYKGSYLWINARSFHKVCPLSSKVWLFPKESERKTLEIWTHSYSSITHNIDAEVSNHRHPRLNLVCAPCLSTSLGFSTLPFLLDVKFLVHRT